MDIRTKREIFIRKTNKHF